MDPKCETLPTWSRDWPWGLDVIRKRIRQSPELRKLGRTVGAVRVYTPTEAAQIREAVGERQTKRPGKAEAVAIPV